MCQWLGRSEAKLRVVYRYVRRMRNCAVNPIIWWEHPSQYRQKKKGKCMVETTVQEYIRYLARRRSSGVTAVRIK